MQWLGYIIMFLYALSPFIVLGFLCYCERRNSAIKRGRRT